MKRITALFSPLTLFAVALALATGLGILALSAPAKAQATQLGAATGSASSASASISAQSGETVTYKLWIAGTQVTSENAADVFGNGTVSYDAETATLTLNGYDSGADPKWTDSSENFCTLHSEVEGLTVNVVGDSTIRGAGPSCRAYSEYAWAAFFEKEATIRIADGVTFDLWAGTAIGPTRQGGLGTYADLTITGTGAMNLRAASNDVCGYMVNEGKITIDGPDVTITASTKTWSYCTYDSNIDVKSGSLTMDATEAGTYLMYQYTSVTAGEGLAIYVGNSADSLEKQYGQSCGGAHRAGYLKVCEPFTYDLWICGVQVSKQNMDDLTAIDGVDVADGGHATFDHETNTLSLKDATIVNTGAVTSGDSSRIGPGISSEIPLTISAEGTCSVAANANWGDTNAIQATGYDGATSSYYDLSVSLAAGSTLTCQGRDVCGYEGTSGIYCSGDVSVSGAGTLNAIGGNMHDGDAYSNSSGISADGAFALNGSATVNATGGAFDGTKSRYAFSAGVGSGKQIAVSGGTLNAQGRGGAHCEECCGLHAPSVAVQGGSVTATAGMATVVSAGIQSKSLEITGGSTVASTTAGDSCATRSALSAAPETLTVKPAKASTSADGANAVIYAPDDNATYLWFAAPAPESPEQPAVDPLTILGVDGTPCGPGASAQAAEAAIVTTPEAADPKGSVFGKLVLGLKATKAKKSSIKLAWSKATGAATYVIYGNACGKKNKLAKLTTTAANRFTFKQVAGKKVKKGTYYKFIVVALDAQNHVVSTSKSAHIATPGGKVGNDKKVTTKAKKNKVKLKQGKSFKLKAKAVPASKKLKVKRHRKLAYESADPTVATVNPKGVIKAQDTGTTYVYAYAQNGVAAKVKVIVK